MSVVLVTGGSGTLGRLVMPLLEHQGHEVRVLSRRLEGGTHVGDLRTGVGVAEAAQSADVIVHAASDTHRFGKTDLDQTRHLLGALSGVAHLVYVSIVGIDRIPFPYYRRKLACEGAIVSSGMPHTILRATQFHQLLAIVLGAAERLPVAPLPLDFRFQSIAAAEVAERLAEVVAQGPLGRTPEVGGPEVLTLAEMAGVWRARRGRPRAVVRLPLPGRVANGFRHGFNTCPEQATGGQTWAEYVASGAH